VSQYPENVTSVILEFLAIKNFLPAGFQQSVTQYPCIFKEIIL